MGGERLEVLLADAGMAPAAADALAAMSEGPPGIEGATVSLATRGRDGTIVEAVRRLHARGGAVRDLGLRRPTLDDVFLALTGRSAEAAENEGATA